MARYPSLPDRRSDTRRNLVRLTQMIRSFFRAFNRPPSFSELRAATAFPTRTLQKYMRDLAEGFNLPTTDYYQTVYTCLIETGDLQPASQMLKL